MPNLLETTTVRDLLVERKKFEGKRKMVTFHHDTTVREALRLLAENNILSAPVSLAPIIENRETGLYIGFMDVLDILNFIIEHVGKAAHDKKGPQKWQALHDKGLDFLDKTLVQLYGSKTGLSFPDYLHRSVQDLIKNGFYAREGAIEAQHRVAISNKEGVFTFVVSQSDVVRYLANHPTAISDSLAAKTVAELGWANSSKPIVTFSAGSPAIEAFEAMYHKKVTSVGLVNEQGQLVGNLSASDLRGLVEKDLNLLMHPAKEFQWAERSKKPSQDESAKLVNAVMVVTPKSTYADVLKEFNQSRVHRLYVVDTDGKPVGIITLTDVLAAAAGSS